MIVSVPDFTLIALVGVTSSGKSTFARTHFKPTEVISSDYCRAIVSDDENSMDASSDAFDLLHYIVAKRLSRRRLTVVDATNVQPAARKRIIEIAREFHALPVAIVFDLPEALLQERNRHRTDRAIGPHVIRNQREQLRRSIRGLEREGFRRVYIMRSAQEMENVTIERVPLWNDRRNESGPFDIIGDVHGCADELEELLTLLGYRAEEAAEDPTLQYRKLYRHPEGRQAVFVGDLVDRGPRSLDTLDIVRSMVVAGTGICVPGNHDIRLQRYLGGRNVKIQHGLEQTIAELDRLSPEQSRDYRAAVAKFIDSLVSHYVFDGGGLVVAHAGMKESMQGRASSRVRDFALFGETTGETDEFGLPIRYDWAMEYRGEARVVYGHTPVPEPQWINRTINIDTGCVFGGALTALRYPELELVSVPARREYVAPIRPIAAPANGSVDESLLDIQDLIGKRTIESRLTGRVTIQEENSIAALEVMSRFAADPRWLIYLPPTMSPPESSTLPDLLEHPAEVFRHYRKGGVMRVVCQEKHMGSRAIVIVCRDASVAVRRFGIESESAGICYTRTGRPFFPDTIVESALLQRLRDALTSSGFWDEMTTDWALFDCELMPWSAKAQELLEKQYAAVGTAARVGLDAAVELLEKGAGTTNPELREIADRFRNRAAMIDDYIAAYGRYCWPVSSVDDLQLAPFHLMATETAVHTDRTHLWHMESIARFVCSSNDPVLRMTRFVEVDLDDESSVSEGTAWWTRLTEAGGEGMVVKPIDFIARPGDRFLQPAIKCRGREYLRIIYGPEYTAPHNLERLRARNVSSKRSLAIREFVLGVEALERFVAHASLREVHEAVFGVLALESEAVDPRL